MKKLFSLFVVLLMLFSVSIAENENKQTVFKMRHVVNMVDEIHVGHYTGETENSIPSGYGLFEFMDYDKGFSCHYLGEWAYGEMCGSGGLYWVTGESMIGEFRSNIMVKGHIYTLPQYSFRDFTKP